MCCRYWADESPELRAIVEEMNRSSLVRRWQETTGIRTQGEIRPADVVLTGLKNGKIYYFAVASYSKSDNKIMGILSKEVYARPLRK